MDSVPLREAIDRLWSVFGSGSALIPSLAADALMARASSGEVKACLPRLLALVSQDDLKRTQPYEVFGVMGEWQDWPAQQRNVVFAWADAWWLTALSDHPGERPAADVLGELTHLHVPMGRWLDVWRDQLDGPASLHLADAILEGRETDAWEKSEDERVQLVAWASGEPIVMGLALVGGVHLAPGRLDSAMDVLL